MPNQPAGPGSPKGSPNKITRELREMVHEAKRALRLSSVSDCAACGPRANRLARIPEKNVLQGDAKPNGVRSSRFPPCLLDALGVKVSEWIALRGTVRINCFSWRLAHSAHHVPTVVGAVTGRDLNV